MKKKAFNKGKGSDLKLINYAITGDPSETDANQDDYPSELIHLIQRMHNRVTQKKPNIIQELKDVIAKHPNVPAFKNYLMLAYSNAGEAKKALGYAHQIYKEHPNYLYARVNLANTYIQDGVLDRVPELLGEGMELGLLYPHRKVFHVSEVTNYYKSAIW